MRNIFLCFLSVLMFAPADVFAANASRATNHPDTATDAVRGTNTIRGGTNRSATGITSNMHSDKITSRNTDKSQRISDIQQHTIAARNTDNSISRSATSVVSRGLEQGRTNIKQRSSTLNRILNSDNASDRNIANRAALTQTSAKTAKTSAQDVAAAKELLEQTASLNKSCQEQYNECMDQFCAVVDTNQKRCSCSANLSKYSAVQDAVTNANNELNQVAQRIRYVGLSADEIRAIMTETQAEAELDDTTDTSETRSMLAEIEALIQDPTTPVSTSNNSEFGLDLNLDFSGTDSDIFNLDFLNNDSDSISSKRGSALYNAAKNRCKTILNNCTDVGATSNQITGNYDLAIDKDCIAYEQGLKKMNETLQSNVRSAVLMLQKARLSVLQNKNQYDVKGCIAALDTCMTDDMVCGSGYSKCLDPTKKYIDEAGNVVLGQDITNITDFMESFNNASVDSIKLSAASAITINESTCKSNDNKDGSCIIKHLLDKIGTGATVKDGGLCRAVLDKCQQYTYNASGDKYNAYNDVVVNYIQRAMVAIKSAQQQVISDYASSCMTDVATCYNQQVTQINSWSSVASVASIKGVMTGACRNVALTCAYAVFDNMCTTGGQNAMNWVLQGSTTSTTASQCTPCNSSNTSSCIEGISEIFYQSLLCPENAMYDKACASDSIINRIVNGCVNTQCRCSDGYSVWNGACLSACADYQYRNEYGTCTSCSGTVSGGDTTSSTHKENNTCSSNS